MSNKNTPSILNEKPEPKFEPKVFHKSLLPGWSGLVSISKIHGWEENKRIELYRLQCQEGFGRLPTDEEICTYMEREEDFHIRELARSILFNGVRVPIILAADGTLLDGNRRYVATRYAISHNPNDEDRLKNMPAWVLSDDLDNEVREKVLVECNFLRDWKIEWPNYIKALIVFEDYRDSGLSMDILAERYGLQKSELRKMVKIMDLIQEFLNHNGHTEKAMRVAYARYPLFEEAHNKFRPKLDGDPDFKEQFFDWMMVEKFKSYMEVRHLGEIRDNEDAWAMIQSNDPSAVKAAIHIVQEEKLPGLVDGEKRVKRATKLLRELKEHEIASISQETLLELQETLAQVVGMAQAVLFSGEMHTKVGKGSNESA